MEVKSDRYNEEEAAKAMLDIVFGLHWDYSRLPSNQKECIGRELCLRSISTHLSRHNRLFYLMESFALLYMQLEDHSDSFSNFVQKKVQEKATRQIRPQDCFALFRNCAVQPEYKYVQAS